ncbi:hypothetical protein CPB86DRAFT_726800 [Serendipita vermifera]|nr:hypothetical protein CPB86DRAFT_726800 [Serendipita vermifera]
MRRGLLLMSKTIKSIGNTMNRMEKSSNITQNGTSTAESSEQAAKRLAKENKHKLYMDQLEVDLNDILHRTSAAGAALERRQKTKERVEHGLQKTFGNHVSVESIGLDRIGLSMAHAPLELVVVDHRKHVEQPLKQDDTLYQPLALLQALRDVGISGNLYSPPIWIAPESIRRPFTIPDTAIIEESLEFVLLPPSPAHSVRVTLLEKANRAYSSMRNVLGLLYLFTIVDGNVDHPPMITRVISYLTLAYYSHKYNASPRSQVQTPPTTGVVPTEAPVLWHSHPADIQPLDGSFDASSGKKAPFNIVTSPSEFRQNRKAHSVAYDLLQLLGWWDGIVWDQTVILPTSPSTLQRSFGTKLIKNQTWDWNHSPLILQDPINPQDNLATLISPTSYAELRRTCRSLWRNLRSGLGIGVARRLARPLHFTPPPSNLLLSRQLTTQSISDCGEGLTVQINKYYQTSRPSSTVYQSRTQTLKALDEIIRKNFRGSYSVALFGSSRYGVSNESSDLDVVILDKNRPHGFVPDDRDNGLPKIYNLRNLVRVMQPRFTHIVSIPSAKVPIIKAKDSKTNLNIDVNVNDRLGLHNTLLLQHYCTLWPPLSSLIYVIKKWAKARGLNEPSGQRGSPTFSSYCLTLMIVGFLQTHGILPNLQGHFPGRPGDISPSDDGRLGRAQGRHENTFFWIRSGQNTRVRCPVQWYAMPVEEWKPSASPSIGRVFYSWLFYYAFELKYDEFAIRIAEGGTVPRRSRPRPDPTEKKAIKASKKRKAKEAAAAAQAEANMVQSIPITDDVQAEEIATAAAEAAEIQKQDDALDESLLENQFVRKSQLDEPSRWANECFVVGDPFIGHKNCSGSITKRVLNEFIAQCQATLQMIDSGASLTDILSKGSSNMASPNGKAKGKGKNKGKEKEGKQGQARGPKQTRRNSTRSQADPAIAGQTSQVHAPPAGPSSKADQKPNIDKLESHSQTQQRVNTAAPSEGSSVSRNQEAPRVERL